jgi:hypothetical protein
VSKKAVKSAKAPTDSGIIEALKRAVEELVCRRKRPEELQGIIAESKTLARQWKDPHSAENRKDRRPLFDDTCTNTTFLLAGLVVDLERDHQHLESIRRRFPNELEKLSRDTLYADAHAAASIWSESQPRPTRNQKYELKRRSSHRWDVGLIEWEFGGAQEAYWRKQMLLHWPDDPVYKAVTPPTCLDDIFAGRAVNMLRLVALFRIDRHQLSKLVSNKKHRETLYDGGMVARIMDKLLNERSRIPKESARGRPHRLPWLNDFDLRSRVLRRIEERIQSLNNLLWSIAANEVDVSKLSDAEIQFLTGVFEHFRSYPEWQKAIANPFLSVVRRHIPESGEK